MRDPEQIARSWLAKADKDGDSFDRFIALWIGFNALYSQDHGTDDGSESSQVHQWALTGLNADARRVREILDQPESQFFGRRIIRDARDRRSDTAEWAAKLRNGQNSPRYRLAALLKILYRVRCNLFHGGKSFHRDSDHEVVTNAGQVMMRVLRLQLGSTDEQATPVEDRRS